MSRRWLRDDEYVERRASYRPMPPTPRTGPEGAGLALVVRGEAGQRGVVASPELLRLMQQSFGNRAVQRFLSASPPVVEARRAPAAVGTVQRHAEAAQEFMFQADAQADLDEHAQQSVVAVLTRDAEQDGGDGTAVQTLVAPSAVQRAPDGTPAMQRQPKKSGMDQAAQAIVDHAQDSTIGIDVRARDTVTRIVEQYYPGDRANVGRVEYVQDDPGLTTSWDPPASDPKPFLKVGDAFVRATTASYFSRKVLQVGHEMVHVRQFKSKTPGLGAKYKHEREFVAFHWEATAPTAAGTGKDMSHKTRVELIDEALKHLACLPAGTFAKEKKELLDLRAKHDGVDREGDKTLPTTSPPSTCSDTTK